MKPKTNWFLARAGIAFVAFNLLAANAAELTWTSSNPSGTVWTAAGVWDGPATWANDDSVTFINTTTVNLGANISQSGITIAAGETLTLNNTTAVKITGTGGITGNLTKTGNTLLRLSHSGGFDGTLGINGQWVILGSANTDPTGQTSNLTKVNIISGGLIMGSAYNGGSLTIGELSGSGSVRTDWADGGTNDTRTMIVDQSSDSTYSGTFNAGSSGRAIGFGKSGSGTLTISNNAALTSGNAGIRDIDVAGGTLKISGSTGGNSPVNNIAGTTLSIASGATFEAANSTSGIPAGISKAISGAGTFLRNGSGNFVISGTDNGSFTGTWKATNGTYGFVSETSMGGGDIVLDGGGIFMNADGAGISSAKTITLDAGGGFFDGSTGWTQTWSANITGTGGLTKRSGMLLILDGNNDYAGNTTVTSGTLRINGAHSGTGSVNVNSGTRLEGTGSVAGAVNVTGVLAPGASIESFGTSDLTFGAASTFEYELDSSSLNGDLVYSSGVLNLANGTTLTLTELASGVLAEGDKLTLISYNGGWSDGNLFSYLGEPVADDSSITLGDNTWLFNYDDISGGSNFTTDQASGTTFVTMTVIPEPSSSLLLLVGTIALARRKR